MHPAASPVMDYVTVRQDRVPALGLGTYGLRGREAERSIAQALEMGYRHVDTAHMYDNEEEVGRALRASGVDRNDVFLTTKQWPDRLSREAMREGIEDSLRRVGTDYMDLFLVHWPPRSGAIEEPIETLRELQTEGRIRHGGVSNFTPSLVRRALEIFPVFCQQIEYHPFLDQSEQLDLARRNGYMITAYAPLARGRVAEDATVGAIAGRHEKTPVQVALRWLTQQQIVAAIPKASSPEHLRLNLQVFDFDLSPEEMEAISGLAREQRLVDPAQAPQWRT